MQHLQASSRPHAAGFAEASDFSLAPEVEPASSAVSALRGIAWLADLPPHDLLQLAGCVRLHVATKGEFLVKQGQLAQRLIILRSGRAHADRPGPRGRRVLLQLLQPGDVVGNLEVLDATEHAADVLVTRLCELIVVSRDDLFRCLEASSALRMALTATLVKRLRFSNQRVQRLAFHTVTERVHQQLHESSRTVPGGAWPVVQDLSRLELARLVGASREMVCRALNTLAQEGRISVAGRHTQVLRPPA